jgi:hypothetical protein
VRYAAPAQPLVPQLQQPQWPIQKPPVWPVLQLQQQPCALAERPPLVTVPYCTRCGISYPPGATLCSSCGSPLTQAMAT